MYLLSQLWWYLTLAFLLGALLGFLFWRACSRPLLETRFARTKRALNDRIGLLESQSAVVANTRTEPSGDVSKLTSDLMALKSSRDEFISRANILSESETRLKSQLGDAEKRLALLQTDFSKARSEIESAHAAELKKVRQAVESEAARKHTAELNKARESALAEWSEKHAADVKKARDDAIAEASTAHSAELKRTREQAVADVNAKHAEELRKAREAVAAELASKHDAELKKAGEELTSQLAMTHTAASLRAANDGDQDDQAKKLASGWRPDRVIGERPLEILTAPRGGKADDLKLIWGVGPKLEQILNEAGFFHFHQIAKWTDKEIAWVDTRLGEFAGRAVRDKWVDQCKKLATGWRPGSEAGDKQR